MTARDLENRSRTILAQLRAPISMPAPPLGATEREQSLAELGDLIRAVPAQRQAYRERRRQRQWAVALPAAATVLLAVGAVAYLGMSRAPDSPNPDGSPTSGPTLVAGSLVTADGTMLTPGQQFAGSGTLRTPEKQSALVLTQAGVQLTFAPDSRASVPAAAQTQRFDLARGQLSLDVPPLPAGDALSVVTPEATVVVHGTRFSVTYDAEAKPPTCVRVTEGRVSVVRRGGGEEVLGAGDTSGCGEVTVAPGKPPALEPSVQPARPPASTLGQQNLLMKRALAAEQAGRYEQAENDLQRLLARYPDSPYKVEAQRALARVRAERSAAH
jgi:ferric-dicitrate binding protein FerR (iron transport regulator)